MLALHVVLGGLDRHGGVAAIGIGADGLAEFLVERRAADQHDIVVADALFLHRVDDDLHIGHGRRQQPDIVGMSALLTTTMPYMKVVIDTMKEKGIRDDYVVLVGGAPLNEEFGKAVGADAYCRDAAVAVETAKDYMKRKHNVRASA